MELTTEEHWGFFIEFCTAETRSGGPDPQIPTVLGMSEGCSREELFWRILCYGATHAVPYAEVLWQAWPFDRIRNATPDQVLAWSTYMLGNKLFHVRVERRCVRRPDWLTEYLLAARNWDSHSVLAYCEDASPYSGYNYTWDSLVAIPRLGRYIALKLAAALEQTGIFPISAPDIRPRNAWSPRRMLALLWPERDIPQEGNNAKTLAAVNTAAFDTQARLKDSGLDLTLFQVQVLLCEYRESFQGSRGYYPGKSLDEELAFAERARRELNHDSTIWATRTKLFPIQHLGEHNGWNSSRTELKKVFRRYNYIWADCRYDYHKSVSNLAAPIAQGNKGVV